MAHPHVLTPSKEGYVFASQLDDGREQFLAEVVEQALRSGERSPEDFIRHFSPLAIMTALRDRPDLRAKILVATIGLKPKMAARKSIATAAEDLQFTLDESETNAETIMMAFDPDDRVRFLPHAKLWTFVTEGEFWNRARDNDAFEQGRVLTAYVLERGLAHNLLSLRDVVLPVAIKSVRSDLTTDVLWDIVRTALEIKEKFSYEHFLDAVPIDTLTRNVPLWTFWEQIITQNIVQKHGFSEGISMSPPPSVVDDEEPWEDVSAPDAIPEIVEAEVHPVASVSTDDSGPEVSIDGSESISPPAPSFPPPKPDMRDIFAAEEVGVAVMDPRTVGIIATLRSDVGLQLSAVKESDDLRSVLLAALLEIAPDEYKPEQFSDATDKLIAKPLLRHLEGRNPSTASNLRTLLNDLQVTSSVGLNPDPNARPIPVSSPRSAPPKPPSRRR